jgi:hypothetical protein
VTKDQLYDAFRAHALSAQEEGASGVAARHGTQGASSVLVTGAGVPEVNGKYFEDGKHDDGMRYSKEGTFEGQSWKVELSRGIGENSNKRRWFIHFKWKNDETQIPLYLSELDESGIDKIPHNTWMGNGTKRSVPSMPRVLVVPHKGDSPSNRM